MCSHTAMHWLLPAKQALFMPHLVKPVLTVLTSNLFIGCPPGVPVAMCRKNPCTNAVCPGRPLAFCKTSFCGSCHAEFYDDDGKKVNCYGKFQ